MSGRSAIVRKKITEPKKSTGASRGRAGSVRSRPSSTQDDDSYTRENRPQAPAYPPTNGRLLKFSDAARASEPSLRLDAANLSSLSHSSHEYDAGDNGRDGRHYDHVDEYAFSRPRKPVQRTEDVSGIEKSGFRSTVDKKSEEVRKNLTKAFSFGGRKKKAAEELEIRAPSAATHRTFGETSPYEANETPPLPETPGVDLQWNPSLQQMVSPPPSAKLPPLPPVANAPPVKRWLGGGRPVQKWNKLRKDPELWDPNGDVLVYFGSKGQMPRPNASFRLSSHIIEATESRVLITLLREGLQEDDDATMYFPPSPVGAPPMLHSQQPGRSRRITPPASEDLSSVDADAQISYHMFFPTPQGLSKTDAHRHALTTRNVFALLYHASLVGTSLCQALTDLLARLDAYMPSDADNVGTMLNYISARELDDARNDPEISISLLAWSENANVRWEEGWREAFVHGVGMYPFADRCADFKAVSPLSRALLDRAYLEMQLRVQTAEDRLADFAFDINWPSSTPSSDNSAQASADRLRLFFLEHYTQAYGTWPPPSKPSRAREGEDVWLDRNLVQKLQKDFGALYDYLVDRQILWDESETRSTRKWMMVSKDNTKVFEPDTPELAMTDLLIEYDNRMRYPHIPHPFPLIPDSISPVQGSGAQSRFKWDKAQAKSAEDRGLERRVQLAYTEATNIDMLGSDYIQSDLVDSFVRFEKSDLVGIVDPSTARRGRWVLLYAILQTLASVSVDSPNGVSYLLSPRLKGTKIPPWKGATMSTAEATHERSYCWTVPLGWKDSGDEYDSDDFPQGLPTKAFPHPPPSVGSRSSQAGFQTPGTRSVRSSDSGGAYLGLHTGVPAVSSMYSLQSAAPSSRSHSRQGQRPRENSRARKAPPNEAFYGQDREVTYDGCVRVAPAQPGLVY
ncbi:uncharacterized protein B0I36DRAFT_377677 [Microdochium trichocladiopsis]|uniref:DUF8004 domain-containing protein n=1 Tax=Microdochium trichocladiopsis TaxID=1682393 RepID=A0A9P8XUB0_9PEZI|nr:uncharacterized protein B0I36DRAFT_377677 [Microdochium trichocladiopsis]KAH7018500.1 hypothetical protein B0I36DRAFT_377677 [Microdochium trichocladiopsis]